MNKLTVSLLVIALSVGAPLISTEAVTQQIQFAKGKTGASVRGKVTGNESVDYEIRAAAGQKMTVDFKAGKGAAFFNVLPPGSTGEAIFVGSNEGNHFAGDLQADGTYTLRVYLMGGAKESGKPVNFTLKVNVAGGNQTSKAAGGSAPEKACLAAVAKATGVSAKKLSVTDVSTAESGISIMVKVPNATAPWSCLSDKKGKVEGVSFTGSEGKL